jgi:4'-phosphopantetheinyl transferase EntD
VIEEILPEPVVSVEATEDPVDATLFPEEEPLIARAVDKRRREFTTTRHCARAAMRKLGMPPVAVMRGERGSPVWPEGIVGSLTHTTGYRAAVLACGEDVLTIGIDAEQHDSLPDGVLDVVSLPAERARITSLRQTEPEVHWDRLLFCAKEAVYKAWFPLTARWLGFEHAHIDLHGAGTFRAEFLVPGARIGHELVEGFSGRWTVQQGLVLTAIVLPH